MKQRNLQNDLSNKKTLLLFSCSFVLTFIITRIYLYFNYDSNLYIGQYNIQHIYLGLLFITFSSIPLILFTGKSKWLDFATVIFAMGLSLSLDEWVYLIATDGSDQAYLYPISFWGAFVFVVIVLLYCNLLYYIGKSKVSKSKMRL